MCSLYSNISFIQYWNWKKKFFSFSFLAIYTSNDSVGLVLIFSFFLYLYLGEGLFLFPFLSFSFLFIFCYIFGINIIKKYFWGNIPSLRTNSHKHIWHTYFIFWKKKYFIIKNRIRNLKQKLFKMRWNCKFLLEFQVLILASVFYM